MKLLLIEDDGAYARFIRETLKEPAQAAVELLVAGRLDRGLEILRDNAPDLVLLDLGLPDSQGLATLRTACTAHPATPFVVLTGMSDESLAIEAVRAGAQDYLVKGRVNGEVLLRVAEHAVERQRLRRSAQESEARKTAVLQTALDGIITIDHDGRILEFNAAAERVFGHSAAEVAGRDMADLIIPPAYRERHRRGLAHYLATGHGPVMGQRIELTALRRDGTEFPVELAIARINTDSPPIFTGFIRDISEAKRAEEEKRHAAERLQEISETQRAILNALPAHIALLDSSGVIVTVNEAWRRFASANALQSADFYVGRNYLEVCENAHGECADEAAAVAAGIRQVLRSELEEFSIEYPCHSPAEKRWFRLMVTPLTEPPGTGAVVMHVNVTERRLAEEILKEKEREQRQLASELASETRRLHESQAVANIGSWETDVATLAVTWTPETFRIFEITPERFRPTHPGFLEFVHPDDRDVVAATFAQSLGRPGPFAIEHRIITPDGTVKHVEERWQTFSDATGRPVRAVGTCQDITARKAAQDRARASEAQFRKLAESDILGLLFWEAEGRISHANDAFLRMVGYTREDLLSGQVDWRKMTPPEYRRADEQALAEIAATRRCSPFEKEYFRKDGTRVAILVGAAVLDEAPDRGICFVVDISQQKQAVAALRASEERFRQLAENIQEVFWMVDPVTDQMIYVSPAYEKVWGRSCASLQTSRQWLETVHPDDRQRLFEAASSTKVVRGARDATYRIVRPDGTVRWIHDRATPVCDAVGQIVRVVGTAEDITERRLLEEQFRQSQKMEAIGQLAGGVAHDFNNILSAMMMQADVTATEEDLPKTVGDGLREIRQAAERAAGLTRQLLLFSRRQVMHSQVLDLNDLVTSLAKMLQRIIGEDVHLQLNLHPRPLLTRADAGMLDQVVMNLVVNARDAMPKGGRLFIETSEKLVTAEEAAAIPDAKPGRYVSLRVADTGSGISPDDLSRIFEPFFTTKEPGKGTGLGLATVFGIVKQHDGAVTVESEVGAGTTFRLFFRAQEATALPPAEAVKSPPRGGTETILLVEDEPAVRMLTRTVLERAGYRVLEAAHGVEALTRWDEATANIQLLLTDIVMPEGLGGRELAARLREKNPGLRVVFASGYSADIAGRDLSLEEGQNFIQKPFSRHQLLATVRNCLDG
jgi:PAS domain S-box-containing protein